MNRWFGAAAALSLLTTFAHTLGGGPAIHEPILQADIPADVRAAASVVWHGISAFLAVASVVLAGAAMGKKWGRDGAGVIAVMYGAFTVLFVFYGLLRLGDLWIMPQWIIFATMLVVILVAMRKGPAQAPARGQEPGQEPGPTQGPTRGVAP